MIQMLYAHGAITFNVTGDFVDTNPLGNVTITGLSTEPDMVTLNGKVLEGTSKSFSASVLRIEGLEELTSEGVFQIASPEAAISGMSVTQINDGQIQVHAVSQASDGQVRATASA